METSAFQIAALQEIRQEIERGDIPLGELQAFARRILDLCQQFPAGLPEAALRTLAADFPILSRTFVASLKRAEEDSARQEIGEIRSRLSSEE